MNEPRELPSDAVSKNDDERGPYIEAVINYNDVREFERFGRSIIDRDVPENTTMMLDPHVVRIHDARRSSRALTLDTTGFALVHHETKVSNLYDQQAVENEYFGEIETMLKRLLGAEEVLCFGAVIRSDDPKKVESWQQGAAERVQNRAGTAGNAHIDYDEESTAAYARDIVGDRRADELLKRRFTLINLWRGLAPVEKNPLAVCDASSVRAQHMRISEVRNPVGPKRVAARTGYCSVFTPEHRWYYYPNMQTDELLIFKLGDTDHRRPRHVLHTAFADPTSAANARSRENLDIRAICFLPN